ncbi:MAG TPA: hypothetical protein DCZ92_02780 [Elusimicrobia bacterium]|nr:MAG: hypothetical protein A2016_09200 [Elusimicrobia bacterium GWF2_62_30]HBA59749.1 hypothetical protein [Elusimicrobiota bacterium]
MNVKFKEKLAARELAGELYVVDIEEQTLHSLNPAGTFIWNCLKRGVAREKIASRLAEEFEVPEREAAADTAAFLSTLEAKGLIT